MGKLGGIDFDLLLSFSKVMTDINIRIGNDFDSRDIYITYS
jgi:hypothetical protein